VLSSTEVRLITEGKLERLAEFARSPRLQTYDPKGDTPLHLAARVGNLAICDLFVQAGADPQSLNHDRQTPADVAFAEGHGFIAQLLSSLLTMSSASVDANDHVSEVQTVQVGTDAVPAQRVTEEQAPDETTDNLDDLLGFEGEAEPEIFFDHLTGETASGTFLALVSLAPEVSNDEQVDWDLPLSLTLIAGDGIGAKALVVTPPGAENDFLKARNRGPQSLKRSVVQTGTRLSIDLEVCVIWAEETLAKGWCSFDDVDHLVDHCQGNGDPDELRTNLQRTLEALGLDLVDRANMLDVAVWDARSDISSIELAEAIEAALTRTTRLPGTQRFMMQMSEEFVLLESMARAKQELQLGILALDVAVETILDAINSIRDGIRDAGSVSLKTIIPSRPGHIETAEVMAAAEALKSWQANGRVMDGKQRRAALEALEALDLSLSFYMELICKLQTGSAFIEHAVKMEAQIAVFDAATERLLHEHLPYARRFAARNVEECEDPEEIFQVAFMGMQRATRRLDRERRYRFLNYASYFMRQAIVQWRANKSSAIRVPVYRREEISELDRALDKLDVRADCAVSDDALARELKWTVDDVRQLRAIPREADYPDGLDDWDKLLPEQEDTTLLTQVEMERIVTEALARLTERQADVIRMHFGIGRDAEMTFEEIGHLYGVTRERIRQIETKGIDRLSNLARKRRLHALLGM
jgi:RNA polymerase primary sigma factor